MKKLIVTMIIASVATFANAATASWDWSVGGSAPSRVWYANSTTELLAANTIVYLFDAAEVSQSDLLKSVRGGNKISGYVSTSKLDTDSKLVAVNGLSHGEDSAVTTHNYNFYMAAVSGDMIFITDSLPKTASALASAELLTFSGIKDATQVDFTANPTAAFSTAGWYAAAPEPTSGLLMILGIGLVALRRRRT